MPLSPEKFKRARAKTPEGQHRQQISRHIEALYKDLNQTQDAEAKGEVLFQIETLQSQLSEQPLSTSKPNITGTSQHSRRISHGPGH